MTLPLEVTIWTTKMVWLALIGWVFSCLTIADEVANSIRSGDKLKLRRSVEVIPAKKDDDNMDVNGGDKKKKDVAGGGDKKKVGGEDVKPAGGDREKKKEGVDGSGGKWRRCSSVEAVLVVEGGTFNTSGSQCRRSLGRVWLEGLEVREFRVRVWVVVCQQCDWWTGPVVN
ncbi:hypothetical protein ACFE04_020784 [Oxalis oulophora]